MGCGSKYNNGRPPVPSCADTGWGCNYPVGMNPLELINYDKDLYALYRTNGGYGQGMIDAFPYDPVVSTGFLASQYQMSEGMAWAYLLRPDAQDNISLADNLIVPVQTYTNDRAMPPYEKKMIGPGGQQYETSYSGSQLDMQAQMVIANNGNLPPFRPTNKAVPFVGDLSSFFAADESRILAAQQKAAVVQDPNNPVIAPASSTGPVPTAPGPITPVGPSMSAATAPGPISTTAPVIAPVPVGPTATVSGPPGPLTNPTPPSNTVVIVSSGDQGPGGIIATPAGPIVVGPTESLGTGGVGGGGGGEAPGEEAPAEAGAPGSTAACTISWIPVIIGLLLGLLLGYYYAAKKEKSKATFTLGGALLLGLVGYFIARQKCYPMDFLSKLKGAPAPAKPESKFCAGCGGF